MPKTPFKPTDYLPQGPVEDLYILAQKRLTALKERIENKRLIQEKEQKEKEKIKKFISGLLGA